MLHIYEDKGANARALDPYSDWLLGKGARFSFLNNVDRRDPEDFTYLARISYGGAAKGGLRDLFHIQPEGPANGFQVSLEQMDAKRKPGSDTLAYWTPLRRASLPDRRKPVADLISDLKADGHVVVNGVIDDGINVAHARFRGADGATRVDYAWVQDAAARPKDGFVGFGREIYGDEIDKAVADAAGDEDQALRQLGLVDYAAPAFNSGARAASHGTAVLDMFAGRADDAQRIVAVQAPALATLETSGAMMGFFVLSGLHYIFERARVISRQIGRPAPTVVNFSYGFSGGPHNGLQFMERAIEAVISDHIRLMKSEFGEGCAAVAEVILPAGNRLMQRTHAESRPTVKNGGKASLTLPWRLQPSDRTPNYLEIWLPIDASDIRIEITAPGGGNSVVCSNGRRSAAKAGFPAILATAPGKDEEDVIARVTLDQVDLTGYAPCEGGEHRLKQRVLIAMGPTELPLTADPDGAFAPSGLWTIEATARLPERGQRIEAWVQRDDSLFGYRFTGRQSYFDDAGYRRFSRRGDVSQADAPRDGAGASVVRREGSISGIATGKSPIVVGGYSAREFEDLASGVARDYVQPDYSASAKGSGDDYAAIRTPDASAPADRSRVFRGVLVAGTYSGSSTALSGTSFAAPQIARILAAHLGETAYHSGFDARAVLAAKTRPIPDSDVASMLRLGPGYLPEQLGQWREKADIY